mmetsp:Transcript_39424/g.34887  ORF Transcript_39424/g.34887 Transcript_39424/m.34887 type:complete len:96 (+) Transcript_39424:27-314(+)|eukprot:CAMPEP_0201579272 /NCGR_PEP_ID=MMETSP0190_2-20130828/26748_1 /ASSEMBLY_ACC=CAM_ASM_000263 /TAXON_ID=37353 /ORGANISM="Rosalina sp." /LENGTH=95 /DNA_ID=CAMNT_0048013507 /DNA_START=13 /DNA_END=300 /DNA_ORIENTATION=+
MANVDEKKEDTAAKSADEIKAAFEFLPLVQDFIDNCMVNGANKKLIARFERQSETKLDETLKFIQALPFIDKSIHELRQKRDILKQELKRKKNVK